MYRPAPLPYTKTARMIKHLIFDFDGTLVDTGALIVATIRSTIEALRLPVRTEAECRAVIGLRLEEVAAAMWPGIPNLSQSFADHYRCNFERLKTSIPVRCFPGVSETLQQLHAAGYGLAIASSRNHRSLAQYVEQFGMTDYFCMLIGGDDVSRGKPDPEPVQTILTAQQWLPEQTLVVGDMAVDIGMGAAAGTRTCGVTYGNGTREALTEAGATHVIDDFRSLPAVLQQCENPV